MPLARPMLELVPSKYATWSLTVLAGTPLNSTLVTDTPWPVSTVFTNCSGVRVFCVVIWPWAIVAAPRRMLALRAVRQRRGVMLCGPFGAKEKQDAGFCPH